MFIPELITVSENPKGVEELQREVNIVIGLMEDVTFDPFSMERARDWGFVMEEFREDVTVSIIYCDSQKAVKTSLTAIFKKYFHFATLSGFAELIPK